ncbi:MAG: hypothetical protein LBD48_01555 [Treponema sp.]|nr:hypothetical protein [Treponema sp.]
MNLPRHGTGFVDYRGKQTVVPAYKLNEITLAGVKLKTHSWVINRSDFITGIGEEGFDGILGARVFEGYWCELSFSKSKIILRKEKPNHFTHFSPVKILNKYNADFFIPVVIDGNIFYFDIDTGQPSGILAPKGLIKEKNPGQYRQVLSVKDGSGPTEYNIVETGSIKILKHIRIVLYWPTRFMEPERMKRCTILVFWALIS